MGGFTVGIFVGLCIGVLVGLLVGIFVGKLVGKDDGVSLGLHEGAPEGENLSPKGLKKLPLLFASKSSSPLPSSPPINHLKGIPSVQAGINKREICIKMSIIFKFNFYSD